MNDREYLELLEKRINLKLARMNDAIYSVDSTVDDWKKHLRRVRNGFMWLGVAAFVGLVLFKPHIAGEIIVWMLSKAVK